MVLNNFVNLLCTKLGYCNRALLIEVLILNSYFILFKFVISDRMLQLAHNPNPDTMHHNTP